MQLLKQTGLNKFHLSDLHFINLPLLLSPVDLPLVLFPQFLSLSLCQFIFSLLSYVLLLLDNAMLGQCLECTLFLEFFKPFIQLCLLLQYTIPHRLGFKLNLKSETLLCLLLRELCILSTLLQDFLILKLF